MWSMPNANLDSEQQTALWHLRWHWEDYYEISCDGLVWSASPLLQPATGLRVKLQNDYAERASSASASRWPAGNSGP